LSIEEKKRTTKSEGSEARIGPTLTQGLSRQGTPIQSRRKTRDSHTQEQIKMNTNYGTGNNEGKERARETKERSPAEGEKPSRRRIHQAGNEVIKESKA